MPVFPKPKILLLLAFLLVLSLTACASPRSATWAGVYATEEVAYLSNGAHLFAIDLKSGAERWRYPEKATAALQFYAPPLLTSDGQLIIGSAGSDNALLSLDAQSGQERWASPFRGAKDHWIASPMEHQGVIYAPNADGHLYLLDLNGNLLSEKEMDKHLWATPVADEHYVYLAGLDHHLYAFDPQTRQVVWKADLKGSIPSRPSLANGLILSGSFASRLYAFEVPGGQARWEAQTRGWIWGSPLVLGENVYVGDLAAQIYAFRLNDGQLLWQKSVNGPVVAGPVAFGENIIFLSESGDLYAFDAQGNLRWQRKLGGALYTPPAVTSQVLLVVPMQAQEALIALDAQGNILWTFTPK